MKEVSVRSQEYRSLFLRLGENNLIVGPFEIRSPDIRPLVSPRGKERYRVFGKVFVKEEFHEKVTS